MSSYSLPRTIVDEIQDLKGKETVASIASFVTDCSNSEEEASNSKVVEEVIHISNQEKRRNLPPPKKFSKLAK